MNPSNISFNPKGFPCFPNGDQMPLNSIVLTGIMVGGFQAQLAENVKSDPLIGLISGDKILGNTEFMHIENVRELLRNVNFDHSRVVESWSALVESLQLEVRDLHQHLDACKEQNNQSDRVNNCCSALQTESNASCSIATQTDSSPPDELEFLREENSKLHEMLREFHEMYDRISEKMKPTFSNRERLDSLAKDVQEAQEQHQIMKEQHYDLKHMLAQKQEALEVAQQELATTKQELATTKEELAKTQYEQLDKLSHKHYDYMTERRQLSKVQKQLQAQVTKLLKKLEAEKEDRAIDGARITALEDEISAKDQRFAVFKRKLREKFEENQKLQSELQVVHLLNSKLSTQGKQDQETLSRQAGIIENLRSEKGMDELVNKTTHALELLQDENITLRGQLYWYAQRFDKKAEKFTPPKQYVDDFKSMVAENKRLVAENTQKDVSIKKVGSEILAQNTQIRYLKKMLVQHRGGTMEQLREAVKFDFEFLFGFFSLLTRFFHNTLSDNMVFCNVFLEESMARIKKDEYDGMEFELTQADLNMCSIIPAGDLFMQYITRRVMRTVGAKFFGAWKALVTKTSK